MKFLKSRRRYLLAVALLLPVAGAVWVMGQGRDWRLRRQAKSIQAAAESYRTGHGVYPASLPIPAPPDRPEGELFYQKEPDGSYIIWYGTGLGESAVFHSKEGRWED
jgi:hypothetical protein